jgi:hypothetical protein
VEEIRSFDGLVLEELEAQTLDLLPDREEMTFVPPNVANVFSGNRVSQLNAAKQDAWANASHGGTAIAANGAQQLNANRIG